jgi:hypothetical protein
MDSADHLHLGWNFPRQDWLILGPPYFGSVAAFIIRTRNSCCPHFLFAALVGDYLEFLVAFPAANLYFQTRPRQCIERGTTMILRPSFLTGFVNVGKRSFLSARLVDDNAAVVRGNQIPWVLAVVTNVRLIHFIAPVLAA